MLKKQPAMAWYAEPDLRGEIDAIEAVSGRQGNARLARLKALAFPATPPAAAPQDPHWQRPVPGKGPGVRRAQAHRPQVARRLARPPAANYARLDPLDRRAFLPA